MRTIHHISSTLLTIDEVDDILRQKKVLALSAESIERIEACRTFLDECLLQSDQLYYGINTGFGSLCNISISKNETLLLQKKLVKSHACGTGDEVPPEIVKIILLLKIQSLAYGYSGVNTRTVNMLINFYNMNIFPVIFQLGSLGASGDLAPLAHLSLPLIGEGEVYLKGEKMPSSKALEKMGWLPIELEAKEGLALLNGTQFSAAYGVYILIKTNKLLRLANLVAALSLDAFDCKLEPFDARLHQIRPHAGQQFVAAEIRCLLKESQIARRKKHYVQDPYSFRCIPQVHGASFQAIEHIKEIFTTEINAVTDNPNIFYADGEILSGGNFHAQPLALALDYLAIALSELGSISERRTFLLLSGQRDLPPYLVKSAGLDSGYMIAQYTAASVASQNKQLCTPASADSIVSCNGQEDHVSMAANAATKCFRIVENLERLLAIEFMLSSQALEFRHPVRSSEILENWVTNYRKIVPHLEADRWLHADLEKTISFLREDLPS